MFPQATVRRPAAFNIDSINWVVVVLPFVPVIAMTGRSQKRKANSSSPMNVGALPAKILDQWNDRINPGTQYRQVVIGPRQRLRLRR